jgi:Domain of unknown function (DUF4381)
MNEPLNIPDASGEWLTKLADIEMPAPPDWHPVTVSGAIAVAVIGLLAAIAFYMYRRKRLRGGKISRPAVALGKLEQLVTQWQDGKVTERETAYRLATILRLGLGLRQLDRHCPAAIANDKQQWLETITMLNRQRYQVASNDHLSAEVFERARAWLRQTTMPERFKQC